MKFLTHLRRNLVAYLALVVALGTGIGVRRRGSIPNGSVTAAKLHTNAVTSTKIKNGTIKTKDIKKPTYVQSNTLGPARRPATPDVVSVAPYDFSLPNEGRTTVTVFIPTIGGNCDTATPRRRSASTSTTSRSRHRAPTCRARPTTVRSSSPRRSR